MSRSATVVVAAAIVLAFVAGYSLRVDTPPPDSSPEHGHAETQVGQKPQSETTPTLVSRPDAMPRATDERIAEFERRIATLQAKNEALRAKLDEAAPESKPHTARKKPAATGQKLLEELHKATLADLAQLRTLDLHGAKLTAADLDLLGRMSGLKSLSLRGTDIKDEDLATLTNLSLDHLDLRATGITGAGLVHVPRDLLSLHLTDTRVSPTDLDRLPNMGRLRTLKLNGIAVGDDDIPQITRFRTLDHLEIDRTAITEKGLARLLDLLPDIKRIEARSAPIRPSVLRTLITDHPGVQIVSQTFFR